MGSYLEFDITIENIKPLTFGEWCLSTLNHALPEVTEIDDELYFWVFRLYPPDEEDPFFILQVGIVSHSDLVLYNENKDIPLEKRLSKAGLSIEKLKSNGLTDDDIKYFSDLSHLAILQGWIEIREIGQDDIQAIGYSDDCDSETWENIGKYILKVFEKHAHNNLIDKNEASDYLIKKPLIIKDDIYKIDPELEKITLKWVNRPRIPRISMEIFLEDIQLNGGPCFTPDQIKKAEPILYNQGKIDKTKSGRYIPKIDFKN